MEQLEFDRIVARLGAAPPSDLLEACGLAVASDTTAPYPSVSESYQSLEVPGLFVIGAAGGTPLIKDCLDQGYRVVEAILGNEVPRADQEVLQKKLSDTGEAVSPQELVELTRRPPSMFASLSPTQLFRLLRQSRLHRVEPDGIVFERGEYTTSLYLVLEGEIGVEIGSPGKLLRLGLGQSFGEIEVVSGRNRRGTAKATRSSFLIELEREVILRLARQAPEICDSLQRTAILQEIRVGFAPGVPEQHLSHLAQMAKPVSFRAGTVLIEAEMRDDPVYILRSGAVTSSRFIDGAQVVVDYFGAGYWIGGNTAIDHQPAPLRIEAAIDVEAIMLDHAAVRALLERVPALRRQLRAVLDARRPRQRRLRRNPQLAVGIDFLLDEGVPAATDVLVINEALCIGCDNCEKACAETHGGISRLDRQSGPAFAELHLPTSCRHCDDPSCATACPASAIRRAPSGEVFIDPVTCVGCGDCERACPYDAIRMEGQPTEKPGLLKWLLFGRGAGPGEDGSPAGIAERSGRKMPVKCDLCRDIEAGPVCVRACPTGAAFRTTPEMLFARLLGEPRR